MSIKPKLPPPEIEMIQPSDAELAKEYLEESIRLRRELNDALECVRFQSLMIARYIRKDFP